MVTRDNAQKGKKPIRFYTPWAGAQHPVAVRVSANQKNGIHQISPYMDKRASIKGAGEGAQTHKVLLGKRIDPTLYWERWFPRPVTQAPLLDRTSRATLTIAPRTPTRHDILLDDKRWCHRWLVMYSAQTMVRAQNLYVYKPTQIYETVPRLSTCDILLHCSALVYHCSTLYSSAFAQHCIVARLVNPPRCTCLHPHCLHPPRVSPSDPMSLLQVRPLPTISSELQHILSSIK